MKLLSRKLVAKISPIARYCVIALSFGLTSSIAIKANEIPAPQKLEPNVEEIEITPESSQPYITPWRRVRLVYTLREHEGAIDSLLFSADSSVLISGGGSNDANLRIWSLATGKSLTKLRGQSSGVRAMAMDRYGKNLISGGEDSDINIWNWRSGKHQSSLLEHDSNITALAIAPDGKTLVSGSLDGMKVWDIGILPQYLHYTLTRTGSPVSALAINSNGFLLASGDLTGTVKFWNIRTGTYTSEFKPHDRMISGLVFTPDGKTLITASRDRTIKVWDLASGQLLNTFLGHRGEIRAIALHPTLPILASAGDDGTIIWSLETGRLTAKIRGHNNWVESIAFSPDGRYLATGSFDTTVKVWEDALANSN